MKHFKEYLEKKFTNNEAYDFSEKDGIIFFFSDIKNFRSIILYIKEHQDFKFKILTDIFGVDYLDQEKRFVVAYNLLSLKNNKRLIMKIKVDENEEVPSICDIFSAANWYEREVWDMYGISFSDHPDLRRILTDYGFEGYPLRKDFPLSGYKEVRYDIEKRKVIYEPVKLSQEFRNFDFLSPWEGTDYVLPGDEKAEKR